MNGGTSFGAGINVYDKGVDIYSFYGGSVSNPAFCDTIEYTLATPSPPPVAPAPTCTAVPPTPTPTPATTPYVSPPSTSYTFPIITVVGNITVVPGNYSTITQAPGSIFIIALHGDGVFINAGSVTLNGTAVIDLSSLTLYDGQSITLINAGLITGSWGDVQIAFPTTDDCTSYSGVVEQTPTSVVLQIRSTNVCARATCLISSAFMLIQ